MQMADVQDIEAAVQAWFQAHALASAGPLRAAFLSSAQVHGLHDGQLGAWPLPAFCERFDGLPAADEAECQRAIDWIDASEDTACARATRMQGALAFTDYLLLLKVAGRWQVASVTTAARATEGNGAGA